MVLPHLLPAGTKQPVVLPPGATAFRTPLPAPTRLSVGLRRNVSLWLLRSGQTYLERVFTVFESVVSII